MCGGAQAADGLYTTRYGRTARAGGVRCGAAVLRGGARGALRRGAAGAVIGQRELSSARCLRPMMPSTMCSASAYTAAVTILALWCARKLDGWKRE